MALAGVLRHLGVRWDEVPEGDQDRAFVIGPWKGRGGAERLIRGREVRRTAAVVPGEEETPVAEEDLGFEYGERGEIWVFNSGSFVTWGLSEEEGRAFLRDVVRHKGARVEGDRLTADEYEVEEVDFVVDPMAQTAVLGNLILLGRPPSLSTFPPSPSLGSLLARYTLSLALARSSALSVLEDRLDSHIASVSLLPRALERFGAQPMGRREVIRKIGELMVLRMAVNTRGGGLEETPEFFWSEPALEDYFDTVAKEFEIKERVDLLNKKIDYAQEIQNTLRALLTEASGHRMELIIIVLIAVEVVFVSVSFAYRKVGAALTPPRSSFVKDPSCGNISPTPSSRPSTASSARTRTATEAHPSVLLLAHMSAHPPHLLRRSPLSPSSPVSSNTPLHTLPPFACITLNSCYMPPRCIL
jgi:uncharacterized Rmd1/YagE family protein